MQSLKQQVSYIAEEQKIIALRKLFNNALKENSEELKTLFPYFHHVYLYITGYTDKQDFEPSLLNLLKKEIKSEYLCFTNPSYDRQFVILIQVQEDEPIHMRFLRDKICRLLSDNFLDSKILICYCEVPVHLENLHQISAKADNMLRYLTFGFDHKIVPIETGKPQHNIMPEEKTEMVFLRLKYESRNINSIMRSFFEELSYSTGIFGELGCSVEALLKLVNSYARTEDVPTNDIMSAFYHRYLFCDDLDKMEREITGYIRLIIHSIEEKNGSSSDHLIQIREYVVKNYYKKLTIQSLTSLFDVDLKECSNYFYETTGMSFNDYLAQIRIEKAKILLESTELSAEHISHEVGYPNSKYFFRIFKKNVGQTPLEYRQANKAGRNTKN